MIGLTQAGWLLIVFATSFPIGYLLAYLCRDELVKGRVYFRFIAILCAILTWISAIFEMELVIAATLCYIGIISVISFWKSHDRKFVK